MNTTYDILNVFITSTIFTNPKDAINLKYRLDIVDGIKTKHYLDEQELLDEIKNNPSSLVKVVPNSNGVFREIFIKPHLTTDGYINESDYGTVFEAKLCGEKIRYCLIEDMNFKYIGRPATEEGENNGRE